MADEKEVEFYAAKANAWFNTKLEYDKSLLVLSAGAIGVLITLLTTIGVKTVSLLFLFGSAIVSFLVCLSAVLTIFSWNAKHLEALISGNRTNDPLLKFLDIASISSFVLGVILASIIGLATATNQLFIQEAYMTDQKQTNKNSVPEEKRSFNGAQNVAPPKQDNSGGESGGTSSGQSQSSGSGKKD